MGRVRAAVAAVLLCLTAGCVDLVTVNQLYNENQNLRNVIRHNENLKRNCAPI